MCDFSANLMNENEEHGPEGFIYRLSKIGRKGGIGVEINEDKLFHGV